MSATQLVEVRALDARGGFAVDVPKGSRVTSSHATETPSLLVRLWVEVPDGAEPYVRADATGVPAVLYARRPVEVVRRRFRVDGRGTPAPSVREVR